MTVFLDVSAALNARLNTLTGGTPVAWENFPYEPEIGTMYLRPTLLPDDTIGASIGSTGTDEQSGIFQIDVMAPANTGRGAAFNKADAIADHFKRGTELTYSGRLVRCENVSIRTPTQDNGWFMLPVRVDYLSYTAKR